MTYYNSRGQAMPESAAEQARVAGTSAGGETVTAPAGNSSLSGEGGGDVLIGNNLDNRHWITDPKDVVVEQANGGIDTEIGWTSIKLAANVENLQVNGMFSYAVGNDLGNLIIVDNTSHWVYGAGGDDVLVGSTTDKTTFMVKAGEGSDVIYNWNGNDQLQLLNYGFKNSADIRAAMTQQGDDVVLKLSATETLTFRGVTTGAFADRQFLLPLDTSKLGAMTFSDDFNSLSTWDPNTGTGLWKTNFGGNLKDPWAFTLPSNGERQVYANPGFYGQGEQDLGLNPLTVSNGVLNITAERIPDALRDAAWGREYSSGMINTLGTFEQQYGYFEMKAELPTAVGTWPAFWLMPTPYTAQTEADIMEGLAATPNVDYRRAWGGGDNLYDNAYKIDPTGSHTYGMLWTPQTVTFYYDGVAVLQSATPAAWNQPMGMIVNMAVGGWGGEPNSLQFPATMKVDYIHVYNLADNSAIIERGTPELPVATLKPDGAATSGQAAVSLSFDQDGTALSSAHVAVYGAKPTTLPPGKTFVIYEDAGAVFGAVSDGTTLGKPTALMAGSSNVFTGSGTWLTDGKVVFGYMADAVTGKSAWAMVFDPATSTFTKHQLGVSTGDIDFVALKNGNFAASWDAADGTTHARAYDGFAYDGKGWFGPERVISGDITGLAGNGDIIAQSGSGQQLYSINNPAPSVSAVVSIGPMAGVTHAEGATGLTAYTFTITRDYDLSQKTTVGWNVRGQGANPADGLDFQGGTLPSGVVTFEINQASTTVTVYVQGDSYQEGDEQFLVTLVNPVNAKLGQATATGFITNDDAGGTTPPPTSTAPTISFNTLSRTVAEGQSGSAAFSYVVTRTGDTSGTSSVTWSVAGSGSDPASASDFVGGTLPGGTLTFAAGETSKTLTINVAGDITVEANEGFTVTLSGASGATLGSAATATGSITNDDQPSQTTPPQIDFATTSLSLAEGNSGSTAFSYTLTRTGTTTGTSTVNWSLTGSGTNPASAPDFAGGALPTGTVTFAAGETSKTIVVNVAGDTTVESNEGFTLSLSGASGATLGASTATGTITNDDASTPPPSSSGQVYTSPGPGSTVVAGSGDDTINASQGGDQLTGGAGVDKFAWAKEPWSPATVTDFVVGTDKIDLSALFSSSGYTGSDPVADRYISLLTDSSGTKILFDRDGAAAGQQWPNYVINLQGVTGPVTWAQLSGSGGTTQPPASPTISFTSNNVAVAEGNSGLTAFSFSVARTGSTTGTSTVNWSVSGSGSTPASAGDFQNGAMPAGTLTFAAGETTKTIVVNVAGDTVVESNEAFTVTLSGATGATIGAASADATIVNDDQTTNPTPPQIGFDNTSVTLAEGSSGTTAFSYTLSRSGTTTGSSSVNWTLSGSGANPASAADFAGGVMPSGTVTFAAGETSKTIVVNVAGDSTIEPDEGFTLTLSGASGAGLRNLTATGTITNDDASTPPPSSSGQVYTSPGPGSTVVAGSGDDTINASQGADQLTGGAGADKFAWAKEPWSPATVTDFVVGTDKIDLSALFSAAGYTGSDPVADKYISLLTDSSGTKILFDRDGVATGQQWPNYIINLQGVTQPVTWAQLAAGGGGSTTPPPASSPVLSFQSTSASGAEGNSGSNAIVFTVTRSGSTAATSTVNWTVYGSTGHPADAADFLNGVMPSGSLTFAAGETSRMIYVSVTGDTTFEGDEGFLITLSNPTGATLGTASASGTIVNDDAGTPPPSGTTGQVYNSPGPGSTVTAGSGDDTINASQGADTLTGAGGADHFVFANPVWNAGRITDFVHGVDQIDLRGILDQAGYTGTDAIADGYVLLRVSGANTEVLVDMDGPNASGQWPITITKLMGVSPSTLTSGDFIFQ